MRRIIASAFVVLVSVSPVQALGEGGDNVPIIVPERLQQIAGGLPIAERLNIDWNKEVKADDVSRYLGLLAAVNEVAVAVAKKNGRDVPGDNDYYAALAAFCLFPPNKPPLAEKYWYATFDAFYDAKTRAALDKSIGPLTYGIPKLLEESSGDASKLLDFFPKTEDEYLTDVINFKELESQK
ncbi:hypothetical protein [Taklimakanibacter lacteus]|uniref:hypothetical protein n=1 Tax=Taklimakanibacter lacteus TaxID=2268456 RepID=UPI000E668F92